MGRRAADAGTAGPAGRRLRPGADRLRRLRAAQPAGRRSRHRPHRRGRRPGDAGRAAHQAGRPDPAGPAPAAVRRRHPGRRRGPPARRRPAAPDGDRSALWRRLRSLVAQRRRRVGDAAHRAGGQRRPGGLAGGVGTVPRRRRLRLACGGPRHHGGGKPDRLRLRSPGADHLGKEPLRAGPWRLPLAARAVLVRGPQGRPQPLAGGPGPVDAVVDRGHGRRGRGDGARHPEAGRGDAPADRQQQRPRRRGLRAVRRLRHDADRRGDGGAGLPGDGAGAGLLRRHRRALGGVHRPVGDPPFRRARTLCVARKRGRSWQAASRSRRT